MAASSGTGVVDPSFAYLSKSGGWQTEASCYTVLKRRGHRPGFFSSHPAGDKRREDGVGVVSFQQVPHMAFWATDVGVLIGAYGSHI